MPGTLYIVASPIGCLQDISHHALEVLRSVDLIACEDTRHSSVLLHHFGINTPVIPYHSHNEETCSALLLEKLITGKSIALMSDAGTPLIHDPGLHIVRHCREAGIRVVPIPGPCALIAALSASGLSGSAFIFAGFLPNKSSARKKALAFVENETRTVIFYEAPHRILESLQDMMEILGGTRQAVLARELTKMHETFLSGTLFELHQQLLADHHQQKGEFVILIDGVKEQESAENLSEAKRIFEILKAELSQKQAAQLTAKITGIAKNTVYEWGIKDQGV